MNGGIFVTCSGFLLHIVDLHLMRNLEPNWIIIFKVKPSLNYHSILYYTIDLSIIVIIMYFVNL